MTPETQETRWTSGHSSSLPREKFPGLSKGRDGTVGPSRLPELQRESRKTRHRRCTKRGRLRVVSLSLARPKKRPQVWESSIRMDWRERCAWGSRRTEKVSAPACQTGKPNSWGHQTEYSEGPDSILGQNYEEGEL